MISFAIQFVVFVVCVVIVVLVAQWGIAKLGWTIDPTLRVILGLFLFLFCFLVFLNFVGYMNGLNWVHR